MHPEIVDMKQFWYRLLIALFGIGFYATAMTAGLVAHIDRQSKYIKTHYIYMLGPF